MRLRVTQMWAWYKVLLASEGFAGLDRTKKLVFVA